MADTIHEFQQVSVFGEGKYQEVTFPVSIDLRWIASAQPLGEDHTSIRFAGGQTQYAIVCKYGDFMLMWLEAKGV